MGQINIRLPDELEEMFKLSIHSGERNKFFVNCIKDHLCLSESDEIVSLLDSFNRKEAEIRIEKLKALEEFKKSRSKAKKLDIIMTSNIKQDLKDKLKEVDF